MPGGDFEATVARLRARLQGPLPGHDAHLTMAPSHRLDEVTLTVARKKCREAAVLVLLYPLAGQPAVVLTARPPSMREHAGQVAFPGGRREEGETFRQTALREANEEVGLDPAQAEVLGALTPLYIPPSRFCVHPFVAICRTPPALFPMEAEVACVLHVPLPRLFDPQHRGRGRWMVRGERCDVPFFEVEGFQVWGATAMMLAELLEVVK